MTGPLPFNSPAERLLLARAMHRLRMERGMSLREVAALFGLDASNVYRAEAGTRRPLPAARIAAVFGVTEEEVRRPCPHCGYAPSAGFTCGRCGASGCEPEHDVIHAYPTAWSVQVTDGDGEVVDTINVVMSADDASLERALLEALRTVRSS